MAKTTNSIGDLEAELEVEGFEIRPYGGKKITGETSEILVIAPGKNTGTDADPKVMDGNGLRGHPGITCTEIIHLGYFDGSDGPEDSLVYRFLNPDGKIQEELKKKGDRFYSVGPELAGNGLPVAYWNILMNNSGKAIKVYVEWEKAKV